MNTRKKSPTQIQFIYISQKFDLRSTILPPEEFDNNIINFLKNCPKDIIQLHDAMRYYELIYKTNLNSAYDFEVIYDINLNSYYSLFFGSRQIRIFFLDSKSNLFNDNISFLSKLHCPSHFYYVINSDPKESIEISNRVLYPAEFVENLIHKQRDILHYIGYDDFHINPSIILKFKNLIVLESFAPTRNNFFTINALIGNFGLVKTPVNNTLEEEISVPEESSMAHQNHHSFARQNLIIKQIKILDMFLYTGLKENLFKVSSGIEAYFAPLIIIAPFNHPDIDKYFSMPKTKETETMLAVMNSEQSENYISYQKDNGINGLKLGALYAMSQVKYLDDVAFLHASNSYSPIVRLPTKGKSIYKELSFFRTSAFAHLSHVKNRRNLRKTISKFSQVYTKSAISPYFAKELKKRNGQIILISDLPLEWLNIENVPLAFTHDICRLPTTSLHGLISLFTRNNEFEYLIPKDILKKTLVIFGSNEPQFKIWQDQCSQMSIEKEFKTARCYSISDVEDAIQKHKPEFLIYDCHGSYKEEIRGTILWIGNEQLTPEIILKKELSAPIVFLSACGTAPTYGLINSVANAFFESGSLSVTTTYLPVEINSSSILYLRLLNKLEMATDKGFHKNWLEFISHIIRTSYVMDKFRIALEKAHVNKRKYLMDKNATVLAETLVFEKRRKVFEELNNRLAEICNANPDVFNESIPEYLFYSNLGRGDLIHFESWTENFKKNNNTDDVDTVVETK
ncbi:MAG: CHAT domain-containing protein [Ginsengibacter sp.]